MNVRSQDREIIKKFINNVPIFSNVSKKYLVQIIDDFNILNAKRNDTIIYQTDKSTDLYLVLKGAVRVTLFSEDGEEFILTDLKEGDFFGEISLIDDKPRSASVIAEEDSTFGVLNRERLLQAIKNDPMIAMNLLTSLVHRLREATEREECFVFLDVRERLLKLLEQLIKAEGATEENGFLKIKKRTHKELAVRIGASREAISKIMKVFVAKKIILEKNGYLLISSTLFRNKKS